MAVTAIAVGQFHHRDAPMFDKREEGAAFARRNAYDSLADMAGAAGQLILVMCPVREHLSLVEHKQKQPRAHGCTEDSKGMPGLPDALRPASLLCFRRLSNGYILSAPPGDIGAVDGFSVTILGMCRHESLTTLPPPCDVNHM